MLQTTPTLLERMALSVWSVLKLVPYADLTETQVIEWVKTALGGDEKVTEIQDALQAQLTEQRTPTKGSGTPWSA